MNSDIEKLLVARGETAKPLIEARSGPSITVADAAARMEVKGRTIKAWIEKGRCVGYPDISSTKGLCLPEWQFASRKVIHEWVGPLLKAYGANGWASIDFLTVPRRGLVADTKLEDSHCSKGSRAVMFSSR